MALANLPMVPNVIPSADGPAKAPPRPLASIHYMVTPTLDPKINGRFGQIDVLAGPDEVALLSRLRPGQGEARASFAPPGRWKGQADRRLRRQRQHADDDHVSGRRVPAVRRSRSQIYEPVVLPKGQMDNGIAACRAEMTVDGQTKEIWLSRSVNLDPPPPQTVTFRDAVYQIMYDVDRKPLGFELKLDDFDMGFEPGTEQPTHFVSKVRLTDKSARHQRTSRTRSR